MINEETRSQFLAEVIVRWLQRVPGLLTRCTQGWGYQHLLSPPACPIGAPGPCCLSSPCWAGAKQCCCSLPWWGSCALVDTGVAESKLVDFRCYPVWRSLSSTLTCSVLPCDAKTILRACVAASHLCSTCFSRHFLLHTSHFFLYHPVVWTTSSPVTSWDKSQVQLSCGVAKTQSYVMCGFSQGCYSSYHIKENYSSGSMEGKSWFRI